MSSLLRLLPCGVRLFSLQSSTSLATLYSRTPRISHQFRVLCFSSCSSTSSSDLRKISDQKLEQVVKGEIEHMDINEYSLVKEDPEYVCPFEIIDDLGENEVTFKRELDGESIEIVAEIGSKRNPFTVIVVEADGSSMEVEGEEKYGIQSFDYVDGEKWEEEPDYEIIDKYLAKRGVDDSFMKYMHNYLVRRCKRRYLRMLENIKEIVNK